MNIKVGDKVRIKTEEELLALGWERNHDLLQRYTTNGRFSVLFAKECGTEHEVTYVYLSDNAHIDIETVGTLVPIDAIRKVETETLDEYICSLTLEERAEKFILTVPYVRPYTIEKIFYSTITVARYNSYDEALLATIEALKQPKEN